MNRLERMMQRCANREAERERAFNEKVARERARREKRHAENVIGGTPKTDQAKELALTLMKVHGLHDWLFEFDRAVFRYGCCHWVRKTITLSRALVELNLMQETGDCILHEIAHALAGVTHWHDKHWKKTAKSIGCTGTRCYGDHVKQPRGKWTCSCPVCGYTAERRKRTKSSCGKCSPTFDPRFLLIWTENL